MPSQELMVLLVIITLGLGFDFINGFHDTANSIATTVATRALTPLQAVLMAAVFNVIGALSGTAVATTIAEGIVELQYATQELIIASLISAIIWNLITWWFGIPSSSSHALIFSIVGAGSAAAGPEAIQVGGVTQVLQGMVFSPMLGFIGAFLLMFVLLWLFARARPHLVSRLFGKLQIG